MSKNTNELKPCPFCGEIPEISEIRWKDVVIEGNFTIFHRPHPICPLAGQNLRRFYTANSASECWNFRVEETF